MGVRDVLMHAVGMPGFGRPIGLLGQVGGRVMARSNREKELRAVGLLDLAGVTRVLEVGPGPGVGLMAVAHAIPHGEVIGIEPSTAMRAQARRRAATDGIGDRVQIFDGTAGDVPVRDEHVDAAFSVNNVMLWDPVGRGFADLTRVLRPSGQLVVLCHVSALQYAWGADPGSVDPSEQMATYAREAGLQEEHSWIEPFRGGAAVVLQAAKARD